MAETNFVKNKKIEPDEYVDMALKNVLNYNAAVAEKEVIDLKKIKDMQIYLINQAETVCTGCGYINRKKKKFDENDLSIEEEKVYLALKEYFESKKEIFGVNVDRFASRLLQQVLDGEYDSKVGFMREKLDERLNRKEIDSDTFNLQLANYKFQLMLESVSGNKARVTDFEV